MKIDKVLFSTVIAASLFSCADNELLTVNDGGMNNSGLQGKLVDAGLLGIGRDADNESRAYSYQGKFMWMPKEIDDDGTILNNSNARIGMCWTGMNNVNPEYSAAQGLSTNVYTNYEFEHVGWLDVNATAPSTEECSVNSIDNGAFIVGQGTPAAYFNVNNISTYGNVYQYAETDIAEGLYEKTSHEESTGILSLKKGLFRTDNSSVFEGEYLVYFPYTDQFTKGPILASEPTSFDIDVNKNRFKAMSDYAFAIGYVNHYKGGQEMSKIESKTLSAVAGVKLYNYNIPNKTATDKNIKTVILYSRSGILYQTDLNASECVTALKNDDLGNGTELYAGTNKGYSHSIYANLTAGTTGYATITAETSKTNQTPVPVYFPVLSQSVNDLQIILIDENDKTAIVNTNDVKNTFTPNGNCVTEINLNDYTFGNTYVAVDEKTFISAMSKIKENGAAYPAWNTIKLLNDVTLANVTNKEYPYVGEYNSLFFNKNIRVESEFDAKLTIANTQELYIKSLYGNALFDVNVDVIIEGMGCCGGQVGKLSIGGAQSAVCRVSLDKVINHGALALGNVADNTCYINISELENSFDEWAIDKKKVTDAASVFFLGNQSSNITIGTLNNQGNVIAKPSTVGLPDDVANWTEKVETTGYDKLSGRVVNVTIDNLTNEITEGIKTSAYNGGKISIEEHALVTVTSNLNNKSDKALIDVNGQSNSATDGRLDVKGTSSNVGTIDNTGVINFTAANLNNKGLFIDQTSGQVGGKMVNNNMGTAGTSVTKYHADGSGKYYTTDLGYAGIYVSQVATDDRMAFVLSDAVEYPSTVIVEILDCNEKSYNLSKYEKTLAEKDVLINSPETVIKFNTNKITNTNVYEEKSFGHCVEILAGSTLKAEDGKLTTVNNVKVNKNAEFYASTSNSDNAATTVTIGGTLINVGNTTHTAKLLKANDIVNTGKFTSESTFEVINDIETSGTFESSGTDNTTKNFIERGGDVTFAAQTTTTVTGRFDCFGGTFERLGLNGGSSYRATVNVNELGATDGTTSTAWPTEY